MTQDDHYLFDPALLTGWDEPLTNLINESGFKLRPLKESDYELGYLDVLAQLSSVGDIDKKTWLGRFRQMRNASDCYFILVLEDEENKRIAGTASLVLEFKFLHQAGVRARLEDVVVDKSYRGRHLGKLLVEAVKQLARQRGAYKISLDCADRMIEFYKSIGYVQEEGRANMLVIRFHN